MMRVFVAAWPTDAVRTELAELEHPPWPGVRWVPATNWHITLRFIGDTDPDEVIAALASAPLPHATAALGPATDRLGRQIVIPAAGVDDLAAAVVAATSHIGQVEQRSFRGHLTVARTRHRPTDDMLGTPFATSWDIDEIAVVGSELTHEGAIYTTLATFATG